MKKNIYNYIDLLKDATSYYQDKYHLSYEASLSLCLKALLACLMSDNKFIKHHLSGYYLIKLDQLFKENKEIKILPYINKLNEIELTVYYLFKLKKFPKYVITDILGLDGYYIDNIIDSIDMKKL